MTKTMAMACKLANFCFYLHKVDIFDPFGIVCIASLLVVGLAVLSECSIIINYLNTKYGFPCPILFHVKEKYVMRYLI